MNPVDAVAMLAVLQYLFFGGQVARARGRFAIAAPAVSGDERFERYYRVQMNTMELLVALVPALYIASRYWPTGIVATVGAVYLVGRALYARAYVVEPARRAIGFGLSIVPVVLLVIAALVGAVLGTPLPSGTGT